MDLRKVYEYALAREREGRDFFQRNAERMSHSAAAGIFKRLADEERQHIEYIEFLISILDGDGQEPGKSAPQTEQDNRFSKMAESELLEQTINEAMVPDLAVLRTAYLIERDFVEFYTMAAQKFTGEAHDALMSLARWEKSHEELFKRLHDKAFEEYAGMPWGG